HRPVEFRIEVDHLLDRVHAGVGAAGAGRGKMGQGELLEGNLEGILDGVAARLFLVSIPAGADVLESECDPPHAKLARMALARLDCSTLPPLMTSSSSSRAPSLSPISW